MKLSTEHKNKIYGFAESLGFINQQIEKLTKSIESTDDPTKLDSILNNINTLSNRFDKEYSYFLSFCKENNFNPDSFLIQSNL